MVQVENQVSIARPVTDVYRVVSDYNQRGSWDADVVGISQSTDRVRVGTFVTETSRTRALWLRLEMNADVTEVEPNKRLEVKGVLGTLPFSEVFTFEYARGGTMLTHRLTVRTPLLMRLAAPAIRGALQRRSAQGLTALRTLVEGQR